MKFKLYSFKNRCYYTSSIILTVQLVAHKLSIELSDKGELTNGLSIHVQVKDWITKLLLLDFYMLRLFHIFYVITHTCRNQCVKCLFARLNVDSQ